MADRADEQAKAMAGDHVEDRSRFTVEINEPVPLGDDNVWRPLTDKGIEQSPSSVEGQAGVERHRFPCVRSGGASCWADHCQANASQSPRRLPSAHHWPLVWPASLTC